MRVLVIANDVVPGMGIPVAAPGLRAWGTALGLRAHGHEVTVLVDERVARIAWDSRRPDVPVPQPRHVVVAPPASATDYVRTQGVEAVIVTNSNHVDVLGDLGDCRLVYDFFAPKMLELAEQAPPDKREVQLARLERRKLAALARSDAVVVNGAKKLDYVRSWLARAGRAELPLRVMPMALPPSPPRPPADGPIQAIVSGYLQPWSQLGSWVHAIRPLLDDGRMNLHVLLGSHWGQRGGAGRLEVPEALREIRAHPAVVDHTELRYADFRELLSRCHLSIDVFARNPERELAMVTRSAVALSCGIPVMHVPFTEVSEIIREYGAGWLVDEDDVPGMEKVLTTVVTDPEALAATRRGAVQVAEQVLEPRAATEQLHELLESLR
jgi:glycosyltransferase involved in cell wall biosynthesis